MRERLPGIPGGASRARLLPATAVFAFAVLAALLLPFQAGAAERPATASIAPVFPVSPIAEGAPAHDAAGFARDDAPPLLLAAARTSGTGGQAAPQPAARSAADGQAPAGSGDPQDVSQTAKPAPATKAAPKSKSIRLFNTVEFRGALKNMPKWQRVVAAEQKSRTFDGDLSKLMRGNVYKQWQQIVANAGGQTDLEKAKAVTKFFNRWPYKTDQAVYRVADYWATPREFMAKSGDCEDYAITKFYALMKLGVDPENMRIVALKDTIRNLAHAILVVYTNNDAYVLDNLTDMVLTHTRYQHYLPQYSINEVYRWAHVRPKKKK